MFRLIVDFRAVFALLMSASLSVPSHADDRVLPEAVRDSAVLLQGLASDGHTPISCQAFFADSSGILVTAWHVAAVLDSPWVNLGPKGCYPIESVLAEDEVADCIVLRVAQPPPNIPVLQIRADALCPADSLHALIRDEDGSVRSVSLAFVSVDDTFFVPKMIVRGPLRNGNSGSAVVDDYGKVVGVASGKGTTDEDNGATVPTDLLSSLVDIARVAHGRKYSAWRKECFGEESDFCSNARLAIEALHSRNYPICFSRAKQALEINPNSFTMVYYALSAMQAQGWADDQCLAWVSTHMAKCDDRWYYHSMIGDMLLRMGKNAEAQAEYAASAEIEKRPCTAYWLATSMQRQGHPQESTRVLREASAKWPRHSALFELTMTVGRELGDRDLVIDAARALADLHPRELRYRCEHVEWLLYYGKSSEAQDIQTSLWAANPYFGGYLSMVRAARKPVKTFGVRPLLKPYTGPHTLTKLPEIEQTPIIEPSPPNP